MADEAPETFWTLLHNAPHWEFELFVGFVEMMVFDVAVAFLLWPWIKRRLGLKNGLERRVGELERRIQEFESCDTVDA